MSEEETENRKEKKISEKNKWDGRREEEREQQQL